MTGTAGVAEDTIYLYFACKDGIYELLCASAMQNTVGAVDVEIQWGYNKNPISKTSCAAGVETNLPLNTVIPPILIGDPFAIRVKAVIAATKTITAYLKVRRIYPPWSQPPPWMYTNPTIAFGVKNK